MMAAFHDGEETWTVEDIDQLRRDRHQGRWELIMKDGSTLMVEAELMEAGSEWT